MNFLKNNWFGLVAIIFLLVGLVEIQPDIYYQVSRWVIFAAVIYSAYLAKKAKKFSLAWVFAAIAVLYNPLIVFPFTVIMWICLDIVTTIIFLVSILKRNERVGDDSKKLERYKKILASSWYKPLKLFFSLAYFVVILFFIVASLKGQGQVHYLWGIRGPDVVTDGSLKYVLAQIFWGIALATIGFGLIRGMFFFIFTNLKNNR
jgi:hypothetical protein